MNGMKKLRVAVAVLFTISLLATIISLFIGEVFDAEAQNAYEDAYYEMTPFEQQTIDKYFGKVDVQSTTSARIVLGWLMIATTLGLLVLLFKLLKVEKI